MVQIAYIIGCIVIAGIFFAIGFYIQKRAKDTKLKTAEETAEKRFDMLISGDGKEGLRELAEIKGYAWIMRSIDVEKQALEKKQSGE